MATTTTSPSKWFRIFGPPGTGKTTRLLNEIDDLIAKGVRPDKIGFFAFTKKAANEAKGRALSRFALEPEDLIHFRTLHSFCFRYSGIRFDQLLSAENWRELSSQTSFDFGWSQKDPEEVEDLSTALPDKKTVLGLINTARIQQITLRQAYDGWDGAYEHPWQQVLYLFMAYEAYRKKQQVFDFTDMLTVFLENAEQICPTFDTVFVDEAQDLSRLQWSVVRAIAEKTDRIVIAGDDDQAIFRWAGADVNTFLELDGTSETLTQSWRVPATVHRLAESVVCNISDRYPKKYLPRKEEGGIEWVGGAEELLEEIQAEGTWLVLAQCNYMLDAAEEALRSSGIYYEMKGRKSIPEKVLLAVFAWKKLQDRKEINGKEVQALYSFLRSGDGVRRGFKSFVKVNGKVTGPLDDDDMISYDDLCRDMGLLVPIDQPWTAALSKMPEAHRVYLSAIENRGQTFEGKPRVTLSTIHGAKGGEAQNVILYTDLSYASTREANNSQAGYDDLHRTFYVGITRAMDRLFLVHPRSQKEAYRLDTDYRYG